MKFIFSFVTIFSAISALALPVTADIAALSSFGNDATECETNGWRVVSISAYADGSLKFNSKGDRIATPEFDRSIVKVEAQLKSSANAVRFLRFTPDGREDLARSATPCASAEKTELQTFVWEPSDLVRRLTISLHGEKSAIWGIGSLVLHLADAPVPKNVIASNVHATRFTAAWAHDPSIVSNHVEVATTTPIPGSGHVEKEYLFADLSNGGGTGDKSSEIFKAYPDLGGERLCLPTNSTGQIQISTREAKGVLTLPPLPADGASRAIRLTARHYSHAAEQKTMSVGYVDEDGATNDFHTVYLTDEFDNHLVPLPVSCAGRSIVFNNHGNKTCHRVIIDDISIVKDYAPESVYTNIIASMHVVGKNSARFGDLRPITDYLVRVTAFDRDGFASEPAFMSVTTASGDPGFTISVR